MPDKICVLEEKNSAQAIEVLAAAFSDNPAYKWAFQEEPERFAKFRWFMQRVLALSMLNGLCLTTEDKEAVALWFEPGKTIGWINLMRAGLYELPFKLGIPTYLRIQKILNQNKNFMAKIMQQTDHYYLFHLGVNPQRQGNGLGSLLIKSVTAKADREQKPCFLETDRERNIGLYEKNGFEIKGCAELALGVPLWYMRRDPIA